MIGMAKPLNQSSGQPQMGAAFAGWTSKITLIKVVQSLVNFINVDTETPMTFDGVIQPFGLKQLMLKPEGERAWQWWMIHCVGSTLDLDTNDKVKYLGKKFKVMGVNNYQLNGYVEYHVIEDYNDV